MHYDYVEWVLYKNNLLDAKLYEEMEEHLYICDQCMDTFLSLIDEQEVEVAEKFVPDDFTFKVRDNIKNVKPIRKLAQRKTKNKLFNDLFIYYVAVASVAIIFTATGTFGKIIDIVPQISSSISLKESKLNASKIYDFSEDITNKTSRFVNNFQLKDKIKED